MNSLNKMDLIDLYYPRDETIAGLLTVPPEQREALLRRILAGASEAGKDPHIPRILAMIDAVAGRDKS
jgi:alkanesulfonate monooxygenase SsuD/methylene tetrahydromethanopterin reductase-like flavin-dependent oxidoreductase (luciferase family)